ncbi:hypothetical protein BJV82DRAFT_591222 [Fennellomyces sp. T-0311]|nr:hypothetical protein BJV82DRAFT_591222 [Fennellomyces sp. T-0311]
MATMDSQPNVELNLPPGWHVARQPGMQRPYYYNATTGETSWTIPPSTAAMPAPVAEKPKPKKKKTVIPGTDWLFIETSDGHEFYFHKPTKKSVWELPDEIKDAVEQMKKEEESKKRKLEEDEKADTDAKRTKHEEEQAATEMTEEDLMWQLEGMDQEELIAMGLVPGPEEEQKEQAQPSAPAPEPSNEPRISDEERIELFTQMLSEKNIAPFSTWEMELPKLINDERYSLVQPHSKRKNLFNNYCRVLAQEHKANKPATKSPEDQFMSLLREEANVKMYWEDFRRKVKNDPRFKAIRENKTRESMFRDYLKQLRKQPSKKHSSKRDKEKAYMDLLKETKDIHPNMRWRDAKVILEKDNRYHAIESKHLREDLFRDYLESL